MSHFEDQLRALIDWRRDCAAELRELEEWREQVTPFLEQLQADLIYRQRRHAESVGAWSTRAKVLGAACAVLVAGAAVCSLALEFYLVTHGMAAR